MELIKHQLIVTANLSNDVTMTSYDTSTWSAINQWKGSLLAKDTLTLLSKWRSIVGANDSKPFLHVWSTETSGSRQPESRIAMPGSVCCMAASPDENYCAGAIKTSLYLWLISSGDLVALRHNVHFQPITSILFLPDNERLVTASQDSRIKIFSIYHIHEQTIKGDCEPLFTLSGHTMPVTGLSCSAIDSCKNWLFSCSMDKTVKVWEINFGQLLSTFVLESIPTCLLTNNVLDSIFIGGVDGTIQCITLKPKDTYKQINMLTDEINERMTGHQSEITCLEMSIDSSVIFSASTDKTVRVWLVKNLQCMRTLTFESSVTNLKVAMFHTCEEMLYPREKLQQFSRVPLDASQYKNLPIRNVVSLREDTQDFVPCSVRVSDCGNIDPEYKIKMLKVETDVKLKELFSKIADKI